MAKFMSPSDLIVMVRSSRFLGIAFQDQLTQCLDDLYVIKHFEVQREEPDFVDDLLLSQPLPSELEALFGEASSNRYHDSCYNFVEARKDYNGPNLELYRFGSGFLDGHYCVVSRPISNYGAKIRFLTWLQRRLERLRVSTASGLLQK
jgi:hypothetical protein